MSKYAEKQGIYKGEQVGTALRTIMSRVYQSKSIDPNVSDEDLSNTSKVLSQLGISVRDVTGAYKPFNELIGQIVDKEKGMSDSQKQNLAYQASGIRQANIFNALLDTYSKSQTLANEALNSDNALMDANSKYMDTISSKTKTLEAEMTSMFQNGISANLIKGILDETIKIVNEFGNLHTIVTLVGTAFALWKGEQILNFFTSLPAKIKTSVTSLQLFKDISYAIELQQIGEIATNEAVALSFQSVGLAIKSAFLSNPLGIIAIGITTIVTAMDLWGSSTENQVEKLNELSNKTQQEISDINGLKEKLSTLDELHSKTTLTNDDKTQLQSINSQLADQYPELISYYDKESQSFQVNTDKLKELIEKKQELAMVDNANNLQSAKDTVQSTQNAIDDANAKLASGKKKIRGLTFDLTTDDRQKLIDDINKQTEAQDKANQVVNQATKFINDYISEQQKSGETQEQINKDLMGYGYTQDQINDAVKMTTQATKDSTKTTNDNTTATNENTDANENNVKSLSDVSKKQQDTQKAFDDSTGKIEFYNKLLGELQQNNGQLSKETSQELIKNYTDLIPYLGKPAEMAGKVQEALINEEQNQKTAYQNMIENDGNFYKTKVANNGEFINAVKVGYSSLNGDMANSYQADINNFQTAAEAKASITEKILSSIAADWNSFYDSVNDSTTESMLALGSQDPILQSKLMNGIDKVRSVNDQFKKIELKFTPVNFNPVNLAGSKSGGGSSSGGSGGSSSKSSTQSATSQGYELNQYDNIINKVTDSYKKQDDTISSLNDKLKMYQDLGDKESLNKALTTENSLYDEQSKKISLLKDGYQKLLLGKEQAKNYLWGNVSALKGKNLEAMTQSDFDNLESQLYGKDKTFTGKNADAQKTAYENSKKNYEEAVQAIFKFDDEIQKTNSDLINTQTELNNIAKQKYDIQFQIDDDNLKSYEDNQKHIESQLSLLSNLGTNDLQKKTDLTKQLVDEETKERNTIQSTLNSYTQQQSKLQQGSYQWNILNDRITEYNQKLDDANDKLAQQNRQLVQAIESQVLQATEQAIYNGQTEQDYEDASNTRINALQDQLDAMQKQNDLQQEQVDRQEKLNNLAKIKTELDNTENEKNIRQLTQLADGSYQWQYVADQTKINDLNDQLKQATDDYNKWEQDTALKHQEDAINQQIKYEQDQVNIRKEMYDRIKQSLDDAINNQALDLLNGNVTLNGIIAKGLDDINKTYNGKFTDIYNTVSAKVSSIQALIAQMNAAIASASAGGSAVLSSGSGKPTVVVKAGSADEAILKAQYGDSINIVNAGNGYVGVGADRNETNQMYQDQLSQLGLHPKDAGDLYKYEDGGETANTGLHWLDGTKTEPERVLNGEQNKGFNKLVELMPSVVPALEKLNLTGIGFTSPLMPRIDSYMPKFDLNKNMPNGTNSTVYNIDIAKIETPNVDNFLTQLHNKVALA